MFPAPLSFILDDPIPIDNNCTQGVQWIWTIFRMCAVTPKEITAVSFGLLSTCIWLVIALPQIIENCRKGIPDQAVSPILLLCFLMGDVVNLLGCIFVHQLPLQVLMAAIGVLNDFIQISQFLYYMFKHKRLLQNSVSPIEIPPPENSSTVGSANTPSSSSITAVLCLTFGVVVFIGPSWSDENNQEAQFSHSLTRRLFDATITPMPIPEPLFPTSSLLLGFILGWLSTCIYMSSRIPQIIKNWRRGSTEGLSPLTFIFAIIGNTSYGLQILLTSLNRVFIVRSLPWIFGSLGCVLLDLSILAQFYHFRRRSYTPLQEEVVDELAAC
ncbi:hypothetical protein Aperf_G00000099217 [Anoplocephala perfoliata]